MKATYGTGCFMLINTGEDRPVSGRAADHGRGAGEWQNDLRAGGLDLRGRSGDPVARREGLGITGGPRAAEALGASRRRPTTASWSCPPSPAWARPGGMPRRRGGIFGLTRDAGLPEIAAATFDPCALQSRDLIEATRTDAPSAFGEAAQMRIDGGMSRSLWFSQRLADLTGIPVRRASYEETTALGAALFAGVGAGLYASSRGGRRGQSGGRDPRRRRSSAHEREAAYARWLDAVPRVRL
ncbi:FGGY-family carbohydrate kinase [Caulobacter segnis]